MRREFHLLVVEDSDHDVLFLKRVLDRIGVQCVVTYAVDGQEAMECLDGRMPRGGEDVGAPTHVLLDLKLPRKSGLEVLRWIRENPRLRGLPVAVLSTSSDPLEMKTVRGFGVDACETKPLNLAIYAAQIRRIAELWGLIPKGPDAGTGQPLSP